MCPLCVCKRITSQFSYRRNRYLRGINSVAVPEESMPRKIDYLKPLIFWNTTSGSRSLILRCTRALCNSWKWGRRRAVPARTIRWWATAAAAAAAAASPTWRPAPSPYSQIFPRDFSSSEIPVEPIRLRRRCSYEESVLRFRDILVRIRIRGSVHLQHFSKIKSHKEVTKQYK